MRQHRRRSQLTFLAIVLALLTGLVAVLGAGLVLGAGALVAVAFGFGFGFVAAVFAFDSPVTVCQRISVSPV